MVVLPESGSVDIAEVFEMFAAQADLFAATIPVDEVQELYGRALGVEPACFSKQEGVKRSPEA